MAEFRAFVVGAACALTYCFFGVPIAWAFTQWVKWWFAL